MRTRAEDSEETKPWIQAVYNMLSFFFFFLVKQCSMWDLRYLTGIEPVSPDWMAES